MIAEKRGGSDDGSDVRLNSMCVRACECIDRQVLPNLRGNADTTDCRDSTTPIATARNDCAADGFNLDSSADSSRFNNDCTWMGNWPDTRFPTSD